MIFGSKRTAKMELAMDKKRENKEKDGEKAQILTRIEIYKTQCGPPWVHRMNRKSLVRGTYPLKIEEG